MVWLGEAVCTVNLKLLGGTVYDPHPISQWFDTWILLVVLVVAVLGVAGC